MNPKIVLVSPSSFCHPMSCPFSHNGLPVVEGGLFSFFPNDYSTFVGILVSPQLYL